MCAPPTSPTLYDVSLVRSVVATRRFRVHFDGNRYSVPAEYAGARLALHADPQQLRLYQAQQLIAEHIRCYERGRDFENPDHVRALLAQRRHAREQKLLQQFLQLSPLAETYYAQLQHRRLNPATHVQKIVALAEIYGCEAVARALSDAHEFQAYSSECITNLLEARQRQLPEPGALHLTRARDLLDLELPAPNLNIYPSEPSENTHETH